MRGLKLSLVHHRHVPLAAPRCCKTLGLGYHYAVQSRFVVDVDERELELSKVCNILKVSHWIEYRKWIRAISGTRKFSRKKYQQKLLHSEQ